MAVHEIRGLQAIRQLRHPSLIRIDQIWSCADCIVIAMELAEGSLLDLLDVYRTELNTCISAEHLCHYLSQAADALDFLNKRQHQVNGQRVAVRHCDVKPSNLLLLQDKVKVADFSLSAQTMATMCSHQRVGTLNYAAPEIFQGWLSDRTDQYALAVSYIELRTGRLPFRNTPSTFKKSYVRPEPDLSGLEPGEQTILQRGLSIVPLDRWSCCREMMEKLTDSVWKAQARNSCQTL
jgi:serine/threonine protein kinase